jgi:anti-sigma factor RsiW
MDKDLQALLPWYVNGSLDEANRRDVEAWRAESEQAREQLAFWQSTAEEQRQSAAVAAEDVGLMRVRAKIQASRSTARSAPPAQSGLARLIDWLRSDWMRPAFALAMLVVVVQAGLLLSPQFEQPSAPQYRGAAPNPTLTTPQLAADHTAFARVVFDSASTEGQLRFVLAGSGAWLVGGPSESGEYYLAVDAEKADTLLRQLNDSGIVLSASIVAQPPTVPVPPSHR